MGEVYEAKDQFLQDAAVALKINRPDIAADATTSARFEQGGLLARRVVHTNLCPMPKHPDTWRPNYCEGGRPTKATDLFALGVGHQIATPCIWLCFRGKPATAFTASPFPRVDGRG
jgi:hypothetical protein